MSQKQASHVNYSRKWTLDFHVWLPNGCKKPKRFKEFSVCGRLKLGPFVGGFPSARKPLISGTLDGSSKVEFSKLCHSISSWFVKNKQSLWMMDDDNPYSWYFSKIPKSIQDSSTYHRFPNSMIGLAEVLRHPFLSPMHGADRRLHKNCLISMFVNQLLWAHVNVQLNRLDRL